MKNKNIPYKNQPKRSEKLLRERNLDYPAKANTSKTGFPYASFEISNFRCLQNFQMEDIGQVNLIAGMNNVGKTALLEAFFLHIGSTNPELALRVDRWRGLGILNEVAETPWRNLFWQFQDKEPIKLVSKNKKGQLRILKITVSTSPSTLLEEMKAKEGSELLGTLGQDLIFNYTDEQKRIEKVTATPLFSKKGEIIRFQLRMEPSPKSPPFTGIFLNSWRQGIADEEVQRFTDLRIKREDQLFLKALKYIEPRLEKLEILSPKGVSMIHGYLSGYDEPVPLPLLGDGARRVASLVLSIGAARDGVVLVDEIENGIHHSVMRSLWEVIAEAATLFNTQVFATTHSQECVYAAHEASKSREQYNFRLHRLDRVDGLVKAATYDQESLEGALSIPLEVRG
jgi:AAA15 family ATPase/GTPase